MYSFYFDISKHSLAEAWVQKTSELNTDHQYFCRTHLGHLLNPGDLVLGFVIFCIFLCTYTFIVDTHDKIKWEREELKTKLLDGQIMEGFQSVFPIIPHWVLIGKR